jgi:hypothetical protein
MALADIERELTLLKARLGTHGAKVDELLAELKNLSPGQLQLVSEALQTGMPYITEGVIDAIAAGRSGNPFAMSIACLSVFSGFLTMAGPMTGPVGPLLSALTGLLSAILGQFLPAGPSLRQEITEIFAKFQAEEKLSKLGTAADQIWVFTDTIEGGPGTPRPVAWTPLDLLGGPQIAAIDEAWQWLANEEKQALPQWGIVLEKTCRVFTQLLRAVILSVAYPSTRPDPAAIPGEMLLNLPSRTKLFLAYLRRITPVARRRGTFWHLGSDASENYKEAGAVYTCDSILGADVQWRKLGGSARAMAVTVNEGQEGQPRPVVTLLTLEPPADARPGTERRVGRFHDADLPEYNKDHPFKTNGRSYWARGGSPPPRSPWPQLVSNDASHPLVECYDIFALPADTRYPGGIFFYTANYFFYTANYRENGNEIRGYVQDADGRVTFAWSHTAAGGRKAGSIRVVERPRGFRDDPDDSGTAGPGLLDKVAWVIYGACEVPGGMDILVRAEHRDEGVEDGYVRAPWPNFRGIGVDRGYLWIYRAGDIACATHASIRRAVKERSAPSWMAYKGFPWFPQHGCREPE